MIEISHSQMVMNGQWSGERYSGGIGSIDHQKQYLESIGCTHYSIFRDKVMGKIDKLLPPKRLEKTNG